jgi:hypothetical protein
MKIAQKIHTLLCDDVRDEEGGKKSLMGIYAQNIIFEKLPTILSRLCLVIFIENIKASFKKIKVILKAPESDDFVMEASGHKIEKDQNLHVIMVMSPFRAKAEGEAKFEIYIDEAKKPILTHKFLIIEKK